MPVDEAVDADDRDDESFVDEELHQWDGPEEDEVDGEDREDESFEDA